MLKMKHTICSALNRTGVAAIGAQRWERLLARLGRHEMARFLRVGALAYEYASRLEARHMRVAALDGFRAVVDVREYAGTAAYFLGDSGIPKSAHDLMKQASVFFDIGSNMGLWALSTASHSVRGEQRRVHAFEPNGENRDLIRQSIELNRCEQTVTVDSRALWSESGLEIPFFFSTNIRNSGTASLIRHGVDQSIDHKQQVQTITFDDYCLEKGLHEVALVKIDVERAESQVLKGMARSLSRRAIGSIIIELYLGSESSQYLESHGYQLKGLCLEDNTIPPHRVPLGTFGNFLYVAPTRVSHAIPAANSFQNSVELEPQKFA